MATWMLLLLVMVEPGAAPVPEYRLTLHIFESDPAANQQAGLPKLLAAPVLATVEKREARFVMGSVMPLAGEWTVIGHTASVVVDRAGDDRYGLKVLLEHVELIEQAKGEAHTRVERSAYRRAAKPGEKLRFNWGKPVNGKEIWAELEVQPVP